MNNPRKLVRMSGLMLLVLATLATGLGYLALGATRPSFPGEGLLVRAIGVLLLVATPLLVMRRPWGFRLAVVGWLLVLVELLVVVLAMGGGPLAGMPPGAVVGLLLGVALLAVIAFLLGRIYARLR